MSKKTVSLIILDGLGKGEDTIENAFYRANTPNIDKLMTTCPKARIDASGSNIGLPDGQMSNSEVAHINMGAGRIVEQDLTIINKAIEDGDFFSIPEFVEAVEYCKDKNKALHLVGLLSDGGVHSHERHLYALLELSKRRGMDGNVYIHCILDGMDTESTAGEVYLQRLEEKIKEKGLGKVATICGRNFAMDKKKNWNKIKACYDAMVFGEGYKEHSVMQAIETSYQEDTFDEDFEPTVITSKGKPIATIDDGDYVVFFNFRRDRMKELSSAFINEDFNEFETKKMKVNYVCMTKYEDNIPDDKVAFDRDEIKNTLSECISNSGLKQVKVTDPEKFYQLTYFFNGLKSKEFNGEDRVLVSPANTSVEQTIEMSANGITDKIVEFINDGKYDVIIANYANADILGHTGDFEATIKGIEILDKCIGRIADVVQNKEGIAFITGDHGNAEIMIDSLTGEPVSSNTTNPVEMIMVGMDDAKLVNGSMADIAPTILDVLEISKPEEMTGKTLLRRE